MVPHSPPAALRRPKGAAGLLRAVLVAVLLALHVRGFVCELRVIRTSSMTPALLPGDRILVDRMIFARGLPRAAAALLPVREVAHGDVVLARSPEDGRTPLVKRCVAVGGERAAGGRPVPPGALWLLGDHRAASRDSRDFGAVERRAVLGRAVTVLASRAPGAGLRPWRGWRLSRLLRPVR